MNFQVVNSGSVLFFPFCPLHFPRFWQVFYSSALPSSPLLPSLSPVFFYMFRHQWFHKSVERERAPFSNLCFPLFFPFPAGDLSARGLIPSLKPFPLQQIINEWSRYTRGKDRILQKGFKKRGRVNIVLGAFVEWKPPVRRRTLTSGKKAGTGFGFSSWLKGPSM